MNTELLQAHKTADGIAPIRKILLLTDGHLNAGIVEPDHVEALTRAIGEFTSVF
jgi:hypothetical protein